MKRPTLLKVAVTTTTEAEEAVSEMMGSFLGQVPSIYHDIETNETTVSVYLDHCPISSAAAQSSLKAGLKKIRECGLDVGSAEILVRKLKHQDWAEAWKRHFKPISLGSVLLIKPSWSNRAPVRGQAVLILDPGLSFGTGQHPTTRFCLEQLVAGNRKKGAQSFLDIGTGSGILAIAAAKIGYRRVDAFDFDPEAVRIARSNAQRNRVLPKVGLARRDLTCLPIKASRKFDLVCANLTSDLLMGEHRRILNRLKPEGTLVLAGILASQFSEVRRVYEGAGWQLRAERHQNEWQSGAFSQQ